ncbi:MAG: glycosyltransferase [Eubacteriales bacterium]|nr:glycosyltransferase [Eubacteriales bacterium]
MNNSEIKVTVVIPIYNAQDFLRDTLEDAIGQTLREIEIICVDDGSTDCSAEIVREYMRKDSRIQLICQENQHAGVARNNGIENAKGEYLAFWDADDRFERNLLEKLYEKITSSNADICVCNANRLDVPTGDLIRAEMYLLEKFLQGADEYSKESHPAYLFNIATNVPWNKLYRSSFIKENNLRFEDRVRANDVYFGMMGFYLATKIAVVRERLVTYRVNNKDSLTGTQVETPFCAMDAFMAVHESLERAGGLDNLQIRQSFENRALQSLLYALHQNTDGNAFIKMYEYLRNEGFEKLGIIDREDYYYSEDAQLSYRRMMTMAPLDYVLMHGADEKKKKQEHIRDLKIKNRELRDSVNALKKENRRLNNKINNIKNPLGWIARKLYVIKDVKSKEMGK